jgi:histidinol-phosphate aminotransferase
MSSEKTFLRLANAGVESLPVYEPGKPVSEVARELGFNSDADLVKLASNENPLGPSPLAEEAMLAAARSMHRYPDGGAFVLRHALAGKLGVQPNQIIFGNGSNELIELACQVWLAAGRSAVVSECSFAVYRMAALKTGASVFAAPMRSLTHDPDAMLAAIRPDTSMIFFANPNNPTGTLVEQEALDRFMERVPDSVTVCFDEAYLELLEPQLQPDTLKYVREKRKVILLRTFSKAYGLAGLRIGYAIAPADAITLLNRVRQPFNVNAMAQAAALAALDDEAHVNRTRAVVRTGSDSLMRELDNMGIPFVPSVANFMLVEVGEGRRIFEALLRQGVIVRPMDGYGLPRYIRVTIGTRDENERFIRALSAVMNGVTA